MKLFASVAVASALVQTVSAGTVSSSESPKNSKTLPHIVFVLTDDNGWAGVGYNNPNLNTPTLDHLAETGLKLTSHYTYKYCAPTRGAFLTGRLPYKLAATRSNLIPWTLPDGTHLSYTMLPEFLRSTGNYYSAHIGKWHQGLYTPQYTPVGRGFDQSFGFLEGGEDHNTSRTFGNFCKGNEVDLSHNMAANAVNVGHRGPGELEGPFPYTWPGCKNFESLPDTALFEFYNNTGAVDIPNYVPYPDTFNTEAECADLCDSRLDCAGYSWRKEDPAHEFYHHCFLVSRLKNGTSASTTSFNSGTCSRVKDQRTTISALGQNGTYTGHLFSDAAVQVIHQHGARIREAEKHRLASQPLFMYIALHNTHAPLEAPWPYVAPYAEKWPDDIHRATFSGMVSFVDETVKNITDALVEEGMWNQTLLVWTNDNGSPVTVGGSNHPLRGGKGSNWEGGTRVPTFVNGGVLPDSQRGQETSALMHIADWYATFAEIVGASVDAADASEPVSPSDSVSAWPWISGLNATSTRTDMIYDHRMFGEDIASPGCYVVNSTRYGPRCLQAALRHGDWKLVLGGEAQNGWFGWYSPNVTDPVTNKSPEFADIDCNESVCLFNLGNDPGEHNDVAKENPDQVAALLAMAHAHIEDYHPPVHDPAIDLSGYCTAIHVS
eukprot:INCI6776.3.p1 GENE.INCI6776.3~~INCI6776.3.p1  ORF type:complete len:662 (-),score=84.07 INCI6776.3:69-2054(-)